MNFDGVSMRIDLWYSNAGVLIPSLNSSGNRVRGKGGKPFDDGKGHQKGDDGKGHQKGMEGGLMDNKCYMKIFVKYYLKKRNI